MFKKKEETVDDIVSAFNTTVAKLSDLATSKTNKAKELEEQIQLLDCKRVEAEEEAKKANSVALKLKTLIS